MGKSIFRPERKISWEKVVGVKAVLALGVATALGAGLSPWIPGTFGTLVGMPLAYWSYEWPFELRILFWVFLTALGTWAAAVFDQLMKSSDNQSIVIDEVIGFGIASWTAGSHALNWWIAFVLFRFFDGLKPPPVRMVDRWSKKQSSPLLKGFGVIADDIVAGFQSLAVLWLFQQLEILPR